MAGGLSGHHPPVCAGSDSLAGTTDFIWMDLRGALGWAGLCPGAGGKESSYDAQRSYSNMVHFYRWLDDSFGAGSIDGLEQNRHARGDSTQTHIGRSRKITG